MVRALVGLAFAVLVACSSSPPRDEAENGGTEVHVVRLEHRYAGDVAAELDAILRSPAPVRRAAAGGASSGPTMAGPSAFAVVDRPWSVSVHEATGSLLLAGSREQIETMLALVARLDVGERGAANGR